MIIGVQRVLLMDSLKFIMVVSLVFVLYLVSVIPNISVPCVLFGLLMGIVFSFLFFRKELTTI
jgi:hypothetical protein